LTKIIGIDPGLSATGIGVVTGSGLRVQSYSFGVIQTSKEATLPHRLHRIFTKFTEILEREQPDQMVVEDVFSLAEYPKSGIQLGKVTGILLLAGYQIGVSISEVPVREAKRVLTGNGSASKQQLEKAIRKKLCLTEPIKPSHASDALGLALIGLYRYG
jgi:crossover junction endodeoxyribonuclease RuvC